MPVLHGVASSGIALVLATAGWVLARRTKELLIGEPAHPELERSILLIAARHPGIRANGVLTSQLGPHQVLAAPSAEFEDRLTTPARRDVSCETPHAMPEISGQFLP